MSNTIVLESTAAICLNNSSEIVNDTLSCGVIKKNVNEIYLYKDLLKFDVSKINTIRIKKVELFLFILESRWDGVKCAELMIQNNLEDFQADLIDITDAPKTDFNNTLEFQVYDIEVNSYIRCDITSIFKNMTKINGWYGITLTPLVLKRTTLINFAGKNHCNKPYLLITYGECNNNECTKYCYGDYFKRYYNLSCDPYLLANNIFSYGFFKKMYQTNLLTNDGSSLTVSFEEEYSINKEDIVLDEYKINIKLFNIGVYEAEYNIVFANDLPIPFNVRLKLDGIVIESSKLEFASIGSSGTVAGQCVFKTNCMEQILNLEVQLGIIDDILFETIDQKMLMLSASLKILKLENS